MKIKARREFRVSLESLAFTDIILNIFIFFFTAFSLVYTFNPMKESKILIQLPRADVKLPLDQKDPVIVNINSQNEIFLGNKPIALRELKKELETLITFNRERPVIVRADRSVVFERVVQVLDAAKSSGVEKLGISVEEKHPSSTHP
ncbi:MAG: biopolymer transporter ExbD [Desulfobacterota bacterium]|nr:biopolymer transporter ExbD [Thermodesulfobacteriota bacterium]